MRSVSDPIYRSRGLKSPSGTADVGTMRRALVIVAVAAGVLLAPLPVDAGVPWREQIVPGTRALVSAPIQSLGIDVGRLEIPAIGLDETIREGVAMEVINRGVAHWVGTAIAGGVGNMVLAGHRTTYTAPFLDLDRLRAGDEIYVTGLDGRRVTYRVRQTMIVEPTEVWIADPTTVPTLTLFACHPKGSLRYRIVVRADLVGVPVVLP